MESSVETRRRRELRAAAPLRPKAVWSRGPFESGEAVFLCATVGAEFDVWQRRLAAASAADAYFAQQIGLEAVEALLDETEAELRRAVEAEGKTLKPRWSPGYGDRPLSLSREILERTDATRRIGVALTESLLLVPTKSVTAVCEIEGESK